ncbi:carbonic anhydrase 3-like [Lissotriton helveticus]
MAQRHEWGYSRHNGPDIWDEFFPKARGDCQSPIELHTRYIKHDGSLKPWTASYDSGSSLTVLNIGTTCRVMFDDSNDKSVIKGGPLNGVYRLRQCQFHWGSCDVQGSEHVVDGMRYSGEIHLIHWNNKYSSFKEALKNPDGVAIVAIFMKIGKAKPQTKLVVEALDCVKTKGTKAHFTDYDPTGLLPSSLDYWTYQGSFTTPPCDECVTWILLREPITVSPEQMEKFRSIYASAEDESPCHMVDNFRPTQPLKGREVRASFD